MTVIVSEKSVDLALYVSVSACSSLILIKISYRYQTEDKYDITWLVYLYYAINILASAPCFNGICYFSTVLRANCIREETVLHRRPVSFLLNTIRARNEDCTVLFLFLVDLDFIFSPSLGNPSSVTPFPGVVR